jgi:hypothetical protein
MTATTIPPTAPGRTGLPADIALVTQQPPSRRRVRTRVVVAGVIAALAVGGTSGALSSLVAGGVTASPSVPASRSGPEAGTGAPRTTSPAAGNGHGGNGGNGSQAADDRGEQD